MVAKHYLTPICANQKPILDPSMRCIILTVFLWVFLGELWSELVEGARLRRQLVILVAIFAQNKHCSQKTPIGRLMRIEARLIRNAPFWYIYVELDLLDESLLIPEPDN